PVSSDRRCRPDDFALRLCRATLFAAAAGGRDRRYGAHLCRTGGDYAASHGPCGVGGGIDRRHGLVGDALSDPAHAVPLSPLRPLGVRASSRRRDLCPLYAQFRDTILARPRRPVERPRACVDAGIMTNAGELQSGKGHRDENFPVASRLIHPRHRDVILAFYRFARTADDIADHATAAADEKLRLLEEMRRTVLGEADAEPAAVTLRAIMAARSLTPQHAVDLLIAFTRDVTKLRYRDWDDLMDYCRYSAMPVGRFVLDVHGETRG